MIISLCFFYRNIKIDELRFIKCMRFLNKRIWIIIMFIIIIIVIIVIINYDIFVIIGNSDLWGYNNFYKVF